LFQNRTRDDVSNVVEIDIQSATTRPERHPIEAGVARVAEPIAAGLGLILVSVRYHGTRSSGALRLTIDKPGGVTRDDCTRVSRAVGHALDVEDVIEHRYTLEVSSPGLDRPLEGGRDFEQAMGRLVRIKTRPSWEGPRVVVGHVRQLEDSGVVVQDKENGREWGVPWDAITHARLEVEW
jgi:ribosome maturation factor RimP